MTETNDVHSPGDWIQVWMKNNNYTAAELAKEAGVSYGWFRRVLKGDVKLSEVIAYRIATVTAPYLKADALLRYETKYQADMQRLAIDKAKEQREKEQRENARTSYTAAGVEMKGLSCDTCGTSWADCSKKLWEDNKGVCCEDCEFRDTHDVPSFEEMKQLQEAREDEAREEEERVAKTPKEHTKPTGQVAQPLGMRLKPAQIKSSKEQPEVNRLKRRKPQRRIYTQTYYKIGSD